MPRNIWGQAWCVMVIAACADAPVNTTNSELSCGSTVDVDPRTSLYITDDAILLNGGVDFSMRRTLDALGRQSSPPVRAIDLFRQLWDTQNERPGFGTSGPHCDAQMVGGVPSLNGFPLECPRFFDGLQAEPTTAESELDDYAAIGIVNRFDLAPVTGENCGEYRIVFGKVTGLMRSLLIFEAKLPNPNYGCGLEGCRRLQREWARLATLTPFFRARALEQMFFTGFGPYPPIVRKEHYRGRGNGGFGGSDSGQIRTNQFMQPPWTLREYVLSEAPGQPGNQPQPLHFEAVPVGTNPWGPLLDGDLPASTDPFAAIAAEVQTMIVSQAQNLAATNLMSIRLETSSLLDAAESRVNEDMDYMFHFAADGGSSDFRTALEASHPTLTAVHLVRRAQTQTCAGCHEQNSTFPFTDLGDGLVWPQSLGFVHNSEILSESGPIGSRRVLSDALVDVFLPHREAVLEAFLNDGCGVCAQPLVGPERTPNIGGTAFVH